MKHRLNWNQYTQESLQSLVDKEGSILNAAKSLGVGVNTFYRAMDRLGIQIQPPPRKGDPSSVLDQYDPILRHLASIGWSCTRIAEALELPTQAEQVRRWLHSRGVAILVKRGSPSGEWNPAFVDGLYSRNDAYVVVPAPDGYQGICKANGWVFEHRLVMEKKIGRLLTMEEEVHHIDGNGKNNDPENLMLFPDHKSHLRYHFEQWQVDYRERLKDLRRVDREYVRTLGW